MVGWETRDREEGSTKFSVPPSSQSAFPSASRAKFSLRREYPDKSGIFYCVQFRTIGREKNMKKAKYLSYNYFLIDQPTPTFVYHQ